MAYNIQYDPKAIKQLQKLDKSIAKQLLDGIDGAYRLRIGDYRVVFYQENDLMLISRIAHRKEVYI